VGVAALIGTSLALPIARGSLAPIDDLRAGTRAVAAGDLSVQVPVTSTDEFADLVVSFNEMIAGLREREALRSQNVELLDDLSRHAEELTASRARIVTASDAARQQVERDLHDGAQQHLMLLNLKLGLIQRQLAADPDAARGLLADARVDLDRALDELRDLAHGIYPQLLSSDGLVPALADAAAAAAIPVTIAERETGRYPSELEAAVYFCCVEALQNAGKHAGKGASVVISFAEDASVLRFEIADDGVGFDVAAVNGSEGLQNMADRMGALGGELRVDSLPGSGTRVLGSVPLEA
jgi:signal transduction histidine kinase